jgi:hypothetical protein
MVTSNLLQVILLRIGPMRPKKNRSQNVSQFDIVFKKQVTCLNLWIRLSPIPVAVRSKG